MFFIYLLLLVLFSFLWTLWGMRGLLEEAQGSPKANVSKKGSIVFLRGKVKHYKSETKE